MWQRVPEAFRELLDSGCSKGPAVGKTVGTQVGVYGSGDEEVARIRGEIVGSSLCGREAG